MVWLRGFKGAILVTEHCRLSWMTCYYLRHYSLCSWCSLSSFQGCLTWEFVLAGGLLGYSHSISSDFFSENLHLIWALHLTHRSSYLFIFCGLRFESSYDYYRRSHLWRHDGLLDALLTQSTHQHANYADWYYDTSCFELLWLQEHAQHYQSSLPLVHMSFSSTCCHVLLLLLPLCQFIFASLSSSVDVHIFILKPFQKSWCWCYCAHCDIDLHHSAEG